MIKYSNYIHKSLKHNFCFEGLLNKTAHLRNECGNKFEDIIGWNYIMNKDNDCYSFYQSENPKTGKSIPRNIECPIGIELIDKYRISIKEAIELFNAIDEKLKYVDISIFKLFHESEAKWHFRTSSNYEVIIGADSACVEIV